MGIVKKGTVYSSAQQNRIMRGGTALKFSPYFFPLSRSRLKIEKSTQYHGTVENREQRAGQNTPEKAASQFESCLRNQKKTVVHLDGCLFDYPKEASPEAHTAPAAGYLPNTSRAWRMCSITCTPKGQRCSQLPQEIHAPAGCSSKA